MTVQIRDDASVTGPVELREDVPLKPSGYRTLGEDISRYFVGIRFIVCCFGALTAAITIALLTQIYYGVYEVAPHGSVASGSQTCSTIGTDALKAGGGAVDAAIASAFCLAVVSPHDTGLDAGGSLLLLDYKKRPDSGPVFADWSDAPKNRTIGVAPSVPRHVASLATLHTRYGKLPWSNLVAPAAKLARYGFPVSTNLLTAISNFNAANLFGLLGFNNTLALTSLANYLDQLASEGSEELSKVSPVTIQEAGMATIDLYRIYTPPANPKVTAMVSTLQQLISSQVLSSSPDQLPLLSASGLYRSLGGGMNSGPATPTPATNIAVIDKDDVYVSLVSGLSAPFSSRVLSPAGYLLDEAAVPDLMPLIVAENFVCGKRFVLGAGDVSTATQVVASLVATAGGLIPSVEKPRFHILPLGNIGIEADHEPSFTAAVLDSLSNLGVLQNLTKPYPSCNVVQQNGDALTSHADSRGGGIASRFK